MATAPTTSGGTSGSTNPPQRWGRSGDSGSAFGGLSRGGRGRGRGGPSASRGGRGGTSNRDSKPDDNRNPKDNAVSSPLPSTKLAPQPSGSSSDKPNVSSLSVRPKPASRRNSRTIPPAITTQLSNSVETASAPTSARSSHRKKRSHPGKASSNVPPNINPPPSNDNLLRSNKPRLGPVPHTAPLKDTPPHLNNKLNMRNDIDALVERVRAVAMLDNRPFTPRSHIDWAGDDDDSLPDLDDWGVSTASLGGSKSEAISPIVVDGLKPLPDLASSSNSSSPSNFAREIPAAVQATESPPPDRQGVAAKNVVDTGASSPNRGHSTMPPKGEASNVPGTNTESIHHASSIIKKPLHLRLPPKPTSGPPVSHQALRHGAIPMREATFPKHVSVSTQSIGDNAILSMQPTSNIGDVSEINVPAIVEQPPEQGISTHSSIDNQIRPIPQSISSSLLELAPGSSRISKDTSIDANVEVVEEGLAASIHAPNPYAEVHAETPNPNRTHTRAHTVGRPPSIPTSNHDNSPRFSRSDHSTPRGAFRRGGYHARNHSSPPASASGLRRPPQVQRPVINADAISRLARTIGQSTASPTPPPVATPSD